MKKNIFNEDIYLQRDKDSLDTFYERHFYHKQMRYEQGILYNDEINEYNNFLHILKELMESLGFNTSLENIIAISYLIKNGYLSYEKSFDIKSPTDDLEIKYGMSIICGMGCCRNFSSFGNDILNLLGYYSKIFYCYTPTFILSRFSYSEEANHVINLIEHDGVKYGIDMYNGDTLYGFKNKLILSSISSYYFKSIRYKPYYEIVTGESTFDDIDFQLEIFNNESKKNKISSFVYEDGIRAHTLEVMSRHTDLFEDFHSKTKDIKKDLALSLKRKNEKKNL